MTHESQPDLAAQIVSVMQAERDALQAQVAALREALDAGYKEALLPRNVHALLRDTEASAAAYRQQITQQAREQAAKLILEGAAELFPRHISGEVLENVMANLAGLCAVGGRELSEAEKAHALTIEARGGEPK